MAANKLLVKFKDIYFTLKLALWLLITCLLLTYAFQQKPYPTGDAIEYIFLTEAFINHQSADIRYQDFESFYKEQSAKSNWNEMGKVEWFGIFADTIKNFTDGKTNTLLNKEWHGLVGSNNLQVFSIHFWVYPLLNVPLRLLLKPFNVEPLKVFQINNVIMLSICLALILFYFPLLTYQRFALFFTVLFSPAYWYLGWVHADVMICLFTLIGLLLFYCNKPIAGMLLVALAATQNQTFIFLVAFMGLVFWLNQKFSLKGFFIAFFIGCIVLLPNMFNYYHFGELSLISKSGYTGSNYISFNRVWGFFFDLNQGLIYGLPFILPFFIYYTISKLKKGKMSLNMLLVPVVFASILGFTVLVLWNMGQAIISRYAAWVSVIFIAYFIKLVIEQKINKKLLIGSAIIQVLVFIVLTPVPKNILIAEWDADRMKLPAKMALNYFPSLYNPDEDIFTSRVAQQHAEWSSLPIYFTGDDGKIKKVLIRKGNPEVLLLPGIDSVTTTLLQQKAQFNKLGYAYINQNDLY